MTFLWFAQWKSQWNSQSQGMVGFKRPRECSHSAARRHPLLAPPGIMVPPRGNPLKLATYNFRFPSRYDPLPAKEYTTQPYIMAHMNFWSNACLLNLVVWDDSHLNVHLKSRLWHWQTPGRSTKAEVSTSTIENAMYLRGKMMKLQLIQVLISTGISTWPFENGVYP